VILLQVDPASGDKLETVYESCYETKDISVFAWSSVPGVGHCHWLCDPICQLPPNNKANYLVHTIAKSISPDLLTLQKSSKAHCVPGKFI
jgi:hypothetical protein